MKKILLILLVLVFASPALADVNITAAQVGDACDGRVIISWDATGETNLIRAFGLNIQLNVGPGANNDANIVSATGLSADYWVNPGTIVIAGDGTITSYGSIGAEYGDLPSDTLVGPPDGNGVTLEAASLYAPVASPVNAPPKFGDLAEIFVDANTYLCITANVSRAGATGVVMEDPDEVVTVNYPVTCLYVHKPDKDPEECLKESAPEYVDWGIWGKPPCWCYAKQCRGDINGTSFFGKPVTLGDLNIFKLAFGQIDSVVQGIAGGICADLNHAAFFGKRVTLGDLNTFKLYFGQPEASVPECDNTNYNFWEEP